MIHHKDFPFDDRESETEIVHKNPNARNGRSKLRVLFLAILLAGSMWGAKYLYDLGRGEADPLNTPLIEAGSEPYKKKPQDPGGMVIPHLDKEIFESFSADDEVKKKIVEPIDGPEKPIKPPSSLNEIIEQELEEETAAEAEAKAKKAATASKKKVKSTPKTIRVDGTVKNPAKPKPATVKTSGAKKIDVSKVLAVQNQPDVWIQLGTFNSEAEATEAWQKITEKNSDILTNIPLKVSKSDLGDKGIFYRLKSAPLSNEATATELCKRLNEREQNCFFVKDANQKDAEE